MLVIFGLAEHSFQFLPLFFFPCQQPKTSFHQFIELNKAKTNSSRMADNNVNEIAIARRDVGESSNTTIEIKIKTLDSHIHTLRVKRDMLVPILKEQSVAQRLICHGKVLKDDQLLSDYQVEDGNTLHLVVWRPLPPSFSSTTGTRGGDGTCEQQGTDPTAGTGRNRNGQVAHNVVFGTFILQDQGEGGFPDLNRILCTVLNSIGIDNLSPANLAIGGGPTTMMQGNASDGRNQADAHSLQNT